MFRSDLYYRISAHALHIPPLRERPEDIVPIVIHFAKITAKTLERPAPGLSRELCQVLMSYNFPGNVREMINMVRNAVTRNLTGTLEVEDFPTLVPGTVHRRDIVRKIGSNQFALHGIFHDFPTVYEVEALLVEKAIALSQGNKSIAAKMLGLSRPTLQKRLEEAAERHSYEDGE